MPGFIYLTILYYNTIYCIISDVFGVHGVNILIFSRGRVIFYVLERYTRKNDAISNHFIYLSVEFERAAGYNIVVKFKRLYAGAPLLIGAGTVSERARGIKPRKYFLQFFGLWIY